MGFRLFFIFSRYDSKMFYRLFVRTVLWFLIQKSWCIMPLENTLSNYFEYVADWLSPKHVKIVVRLHFQYSTLKEKFTFLLGIKNIHVCVWKNKIINEIYKHGIFLLPYENKLLLFLLRMNTNEEKKILYCHWYEKLFLALIKRKTFHA